MAMIARKFKKFLKNNENFRSRESKNSVNYSREVKCYECGGVGHIRADCGNLINSKGRAFKPYRRITLEWYTRACNRQSTNNIKCYGV